MKANVQNGFPVAPRFSVSADPEAAATSPIVSVVDRLAKRNLLKSWPRPPVPNTCQSRPFSAKKFTRRCAARLADKEALTSAQDKVDI